MVDFAQVSTSHGNSDHILLWIKALATLTTYIDLLVWDNNLYGIVSKARLVRQPRDFTIVVSAYTCASGCAFVRNQKLAVTYYECHLLVFLLEKV